jgi:hypothetical protein
MAYKNFTLEMVSKQFGLPIESNQDLLSSSICQVSLADAFTRYLTYSVPGGLGQCLAAMLAAQQVNQREDHPIESNLWSRNHWQSLEISEDAQPSGGHQLAGLLHRPHRNDPHRNDYGNSGWYGAVTNLGSNDLEHRFSIPRNPVSSSMHARD